MRKILALVLALSLMTCLGACVAPPPENPQESVCTHQFSQTEFTYVLETVGETEKIFTAEKCTLCGKGAEVSGQIVSKQSEISAAMAKIETGDVLYFKVGQYYTVQLFGSHSGITLYGGGDVELDGIKFSAIEGYSDITIDGFNFNAISNGGIIVGSNIDGLTVKNCNFTLSTRVADDDAVSPAPQTKNLNIKDCEFYEIRNGSKLTSIRFRNLTNFNLIDNTFDGVEYSAVQIGGEQTTGLQGVVLIKGNTFRNITSRVIHLAYNYAETCEIEDNCFYDNSDCETETGRYIHCREGKYNVKVNSWAVIPDEIDLNFTGIDAGNVSYDKEVQQSMN